MPIEIPAYIDEFLSNYVMDHHWYADDETYERALNDTTGTCDYLPFMYDRCLPDPDDINRLLLIFSYGSASLRFEREAQARVDECLEALTQAHPEFATFSRRCIVSGV